MSGRSVWGHPKPEGSCEWFALCVEPAAQLVHHPVLGTVPTCNGCVARMGLEGDVVGPVTEPPSPTA